MGDTLDHPALSQIFLNWAEEHQESTTSSLWTGHGLPDNVFDLLVTARRTLQLGWAAACCQSRLKD